MHSVNVCYSGYMNFWDSAISYSGYYVPCIALWVKVSDFGWTNNPNTTPIKGLRKEWVVVCLHGTRGEITYGEGDASTPKGWCRHRQRALLTTRSDERWWGMMPRAFLKHRKCWRIYWAKLTEVSLHLEIGAANGQRCSWCPEVIG